MADSILSMLKKYLSDALPGGSLNPEWTPDRVRGALSMLADVTPGVGDVKSGVEGVQAAREGDYLGAVLGGLGALPMVPNLAGIFAGTGAKTIDVARLAIAEKMLADGESPAKVWKETGWGVGPDGKWRFEIDDSKSKISGPLASAIERDRAGFKGSGELGDFLEHKDLYDAYPRVQKISADVDVGRGKGGTSTSDVKLRGEMYNDHPRSAMLHEASHLVQNGEGFTPGGSIGTTYADLLMMRPNDPYELMADEILRARVKGISPTLDSMQHATKRSLNTERNQKVFNELNQKNDKTLERLLKNPVVARNRDDYLRLGGEAEARLAERRMNLNADQRLEQYPWDPDYFKRATKVPIDKLLIR